MSATATFAQTPAAYESPKFGHIGTIKIEGNVGGRIDPNVLGWLQPVDASDPDEELQARYEHDGVLWVKNVIPRDKVLAMRKRYFEYVASSGVLKDGSDPIDGIFGGGDPHKYAGPGVASHLGVKAEECEFLAKSISAHKEPWVHEFAHDPAIMNIVKRLKPDWKEPLLFQRQLLRSNVPNSEGTATKVHFDQCFLRAGPPTSLTAWIPIGDIPPESGGLIYLENSVPLGEAFEDEFTKKNAALSDAEKLSAFNVNMMDRGNLSRDAGKFAREEGSGRRWWVADYEAGDVVFHHPFMIHASGVNRDPLGRIRLATDLRFADKSERYDQRWAYKYFEPGDGL